MCVFWGKIPNKLLTTRLLRTLARCCAERTTNSTGSGSEGVLLITVRCPPLGSVGKNVGELGQWTRHETWQQISIFDASNRFVSEKSNTKVYSEASLVERGRGKWERIAPQVVDGNDGLFSCLWVCGRLSTLLEEKCVYLAKKKHDANNSHSTHHTIVRPLCGNLFLGNSTDRFAPLHSARSLKCVLLILPISHAIRPFPPRTG